MSASDKNQAARDESYEQAARDEETHAAGHDPHVAASDDRPGTVTKAEQSEEIFDEEPCFDADEAAPDTSSAVPAAIVDEASSAGLQIVEVEGKSAHEILAQIEMFADLPPGHLREIAAIGTEEQFKRGATIFSEGDVGEKFYIILKGAVRISRFVPGMGEEALAILREGAYFGEMALVDEAPRSAAAITHESCRLFVIHRGDLEDLLFVDRDLAYELLWNFVRTLSRRLRATNDKMTFLVTTTRF